MHSRLKKLICFLFLLQLDAAIAQTGTPDIRYYSPTEYSGFSQNWCVAQDKRGVMYFGNGKGILEYNGRTWRRFPTTLHTTVLSMCSDDNGRIYIGGEGEVGYLSADSTGKTIFVSLNEKIPEKERNFSYVWSTLSTDEGICFVSSEKIICWNGKTMKFFYPKESFFTSFCARKKLYVISNGEGLLTINNGKTQILPNTLELDKASIRTILPFGKGKDLLAVGRYGSYVLSNDQVIPFETEAADFFKQKGLYKGTRLPDGNFALCTTTGGLLIMNPKGKIVEHINESKGLQGSSVYNVFLDRENELWLAQENGISRVRYSLPIRFYDKRHGLNGIVRNVISLNDTVYISTFQGLFKLQADGTFVPYGDISGQVSGATSFKSRSIVAATEKYSTVEIVNGKAFQVGTDEYVLYLIEDPKLPLVYAGALGKAHAYEKSGKEWKKVLTIDSLNEEITHLAWHKNSLWMSTPNTGVVYCATFKGDDRSSYKLQRFDSLSGLPGGLTEMYAFHGKLFAATSKGVYEFNESRNKFTKNSSHWRSPEIGLEYDFLLSVDQKNRHWSLNKKGIGYFEGANYFNAPFKSIGFTDYYALLNLKNGVTWIGGTHGAAVYREDTIKKYDQKYQALITRVIHYKDTIFNGTFLDSNGDFSAEQQEQFKFSFPYRENSISFEFASAFYDDAESRTYSYKLEGFDEDWSEWSNNTKKEYTNLHEGEYTFKVKAKNIYYTNSEVASFTFTIQTPWYRQWWAYIAYVLVTGFGIYSAIRIKTAQLKKENEKLEKIVTERTEEVVRQKDEIEEKNKSILDSINYAQRIQSAIMPSDEEVNRLLSESFVLFKPKDIVSGDFYWISKTGHYIFVVTADCTGHGVPGAFMSMLGSSLLNELVNEKHMTEPDEIMNQLRDRIILALKQKGVAGENKDGMDMVLYRLDANSNEIVYAAANNPLWLLRSGECIEFGADKQPVGISGVELKPFTRRSFSVQKGDTIYTFTDGYADQFGGPKGKKFKYKQLQTILMEGSVHSMEEQKQKLNSAFEIWKGNLEQIDDVCIIGVKL